MSCYFSSNLLIFSLYRKVYSVLISCTVFFSSHSYSLFLGIAVSRFARQFSLAYLWASGSKVYRRLWIWGFPRDLRNLDDNLNVKIGRRRVTIQNVYCCSYGSTLGLGQREKLYLFLTWNWDKFGVAVISRCWLPLAENRHSHTVHLFSSHHSFHLRGNGIPSWVHVPKKPAPPTVIAEEKNGGGQK